MARLRGTPLQCYEKQKLNGGIGSSYVNGSIARPRYSTFPQGFPQGFGNTSRGQNIPVENAGHHRNSKSLDNIVQAAPKRPEPWWGQDSHLSDLRLLRQLCVRNAKKRPGTGRRQRPQSEALMKYFRKIRREGMHGGIVPPLAIRVVGTASARRRRHMRLLVCGGEASRGCRIRARGSVPALALFSATQRQASRGPA